MAIVAETVEERAFVVRGIGWRCTVVLDEDDMDMPLGERLMEAATKGVEALYGKLDNDTLQIEGDNTDIDLSLIVAPKDKEHDESAYVPIPSHVVMANAGLYRESRIIARAWEKKMKEIADEQTNEPSEPTGENPDPQKD